MKRSIVVDTNLIIDLLRGYEPARKFFKEIESGDFDVFYSTITEAEIFSGKDVASLEKQRIIEDLLLLMKRVPVDERIARKAGELRRKHNILLPDAIIAATGVTCTGSVIYTRNTKDFIDVAKPVSPY